MNGANIINAGKYAIACGNEEIIHLCEQNHSSFDKAYETAIEFHQNDVFKYVYEKKFEEKHDDIMKFCVSYGNYEIISFLENEEGTKAGENAINEAAKIGNLYLIKHFLQNNQIPNDILVFASLSGNTEVVQYILEQKGIDINAKDIYSFYFDYVLMT